MEIEKLNAHNTNPSRRLNLQCRLPAIILTGSSQIEVEIYKVRKAKKSHSMAKKWQKSGDFVLKNGGEAGIRTQVTL